MAKLCAFLCGGLILFLNLGEGCGGSAKKAMGQAKNTAVAAKNTQFDKFHLDILAEHNKLRAHHGAPPLKLDGELCQKAKLEAERKVKEYATLGSFSPDIDDVDDKNYNDNVWASVSYASSSFKASKVLEEWTKQAGLHDFNTNFFDPQTGHFTQMVWKSSEEIGVGVATGRTSKKHHIQVVVVRYSPPGNILDEDTFKENVLPPGTKYQKS